MDDLGNDQQLPQTSASFLHPSREIEHKEIQNPAAVYVATLSVGSRHTMVQGLSVIAQMLGFEHEGQSPWQHLRFEHMAFIRSELMSRYSVASANKMLSASVHDGLARFGWKKTRPYLGEHKEVWGTFLCRMGVFSYF